MVSGTTFPTAIPTCSGRTNRPARSRRAIRSTSSSAATTTARSTFRSRRTAWSTPAAAEDECGRVGRAVQVARRRADVEEHAAARLSAGPAADRAALRLRRGDRPVHARGHERDVLLRRAGVRPRRERAERDLRRAVHRHEQRRGGRSDRPPQHADRRQRSRGAVPRQAGAGDRHRRGPRRPAPSTCRSAMPPGPSCRRRSRPGPSMSRTRRSPGRGRPSSPRSCSRGRWTAADVERAEVAELRVAARPECADRGQPGQRPRLRVVAPLQVHVAGRRDHGRAVDRRRRDVQPPVRVAGVRPFDQGSTQTSFRTNGFQTMAFDAAGRAYLAWTERGHAPRAAGPGDRRRAHRHLDVDQRHDLDGAVRHPAGGAGASGDAGADVPRRQAAAAVLRPARGRVQIFAPFVDEFDIGLAGSPVRHTMDVFVAQALPGAAPVFTTARLSDYATGFLPGTEAAAAAAVQPAEPAVVPIGQHAVHGRLHRPGAGAGVRAAPERDVVAQHGAGRRR